MLKASVLLKVVKTCDAFVCRDESCNRCPQRTYENMKNEENVQNVNGNHNVSFLYTQFFYFEQNANYWRSSSPELYSSIV